MATKNFLQLVCIGFAGINLIIGFFTKDKEARFHHLTSTHIYSAASFIISALP